MSMTKHFIVDSTSVVPLVKNCGYCIASDEITVAGHHVGYMYREQAEDANDSGWRFFSGDETQEYVDNPDNFGIYDVNTIANYDRNIIPYLNSSVGSEYVRCNDNFILIQSDEIDLCK